MLEVSEVSNDRDALGKARAVLSVDGRDLPRCRDAQLLYGALLDLLDIIGPAETEAFLRDGLLRHSDERYWEYVAPPMVDIPPSSFLMGTSPLNRRHFCGEVPAHRVELSAFQIASYAVTNELYSLLYPDKGSTARQDRRKPAVAVTWFEAALLALWLGCRLPTEAEWEFACGGGSGHEWCCADEQDLYLYAWYCRNSNGEVHDVGCREPNMLGIYDMHGNVWEWCADTYDQGYYATSPLRDPINLAPPTGRGGTAEIHKVCRGGSMQSLSEMCRIRFRFHDPLIFWASDLGFRLARSHELGMEGPLAWLR